MAGLTPAHLLIILVIALVVIGPGKLPEVGAAIGKSFREFQKATGQIADPLQSALQPTQQPGQQVPAAPVQPAPAPVAPAQVIQSAPYYPAQQPGYPAPSYPPQPGYPAPVYPPAPGYPPQSYPPQPGYGYQPVQSAPDGTQTPPAGPQA
jgi:TatA/E family protein of Tat protein translocase